MRGVLLVALASLAATGVAGSAEERLPWPVDLLLDWGEGPGATALLEELERALLGELNARGCFREFRVPHAGAEEAGAGIVLEVTLSGVEEESRYAQSMAERARPLDAVETAFDHVALVEAHVRVRLRLRAGGPSLREDAFRKVASARPLTLGGDARALAWAEFVREIARRTRVLTCKGSSSRMAERIRAVMAAPPEGEAPRSR